MLGAGALVDLVCHAPAHEALARHAGRVVLTPHAGEMARMLGMPREAVEADPLQVGRRAAAMLHCVVVMKGSRTHVASPQGEAWLFDDGTVGLATSGGGLGRVPAWPRRQPADVSARRDRVLASKLLAEISSVVSEAMSKDGALPHTPPG